jgi:hypothetical protein
MSPMMAHPNSGEKFYLRMLLCKVQGAQSFEYLRTINDEVCPTFKGACSALGLLADDNEWAACLLEASATLMPSALRNLFVQILIFNQPADCLALWEFEIGNKHYIYYLHTYLSSSNI